MINSVLAINIRLSGEDTAHGSVTKNGKLRTDSEMNIGSYAPSRSIDNGYLTLLTIADKDEVLELLGNIDNTTNPSYRGLSPLHIRSDSSSRKGSIENFVPYQKGSNNGNLLNNSNNTNSINMNSMSSSSSDGPTPLFNPPNRMNIHPDLQELLGSLDPTVSLDELSAFLEQPLAEVNQSTRIHVYSPLVI